MNLPISFDLALLNDAAQVAILYFAFYGILRAARGSRFGQALMGAGLLFVILLAFTYLFHFEVLAAVLRNLLLYLALSSVVIFQPEIRRALATLGALLFQDRANFQRERGRVTPELFTDIVFKLAARRIGALLAFERGISLRGHQLTGVAIDALPSPELLVSILTEPVPLHDGGIILRNYRVAAAHCLFPVSGKTELSETGMRHRAAVGLSEETDALVIVVSEERGLISVAHNGRLTRFDDLGPATRAAVLRLLRGALPQKKSAAEAAADWLRTRVIRFFEAHRAKSAGQPKEECAA